MDAKDYNTGLRLLRSINKEVSDDFEAFIVRLDKKAKMQAEPNQHSGGN